MVGEAVVVFHGHGDFGEAGLVECPPEAVSGVGEVVAALDGDLGGVEADEDYVEVVFEVVGEGVHGFEFALCCQLGLCRRDSSAPLRCAQNDMGRAPRCAHNDMSGVLGMTGSGAKGGEIPRGTRITCWGFRHGRRGALGMTWDTGFWMS